MVHVRLRECERWHLSRLLDAHDGHLRRGEDRAHQKHRHDREQSKVEANQEKGDAGRVVEAVSLADGIVIVAKLDKHRAEVKDQQQNLRRRMQVAVDLVVERADRLFSRQACDRDEKGAKQPPQVAIVWNEQHKAGQRTLAQQLDWLIEAVRGLVLTPQELACA